MIGTFAFEPRGHDDHISIKHIAILLQLIVAIVVN